MQNTPRYIRDRLAELPGVAPKFTDAQLAQRAAILRAGRSLMAEEGRVGMTLANVARLIWVPAAAIRRHFINLDCLLYDILMAHLMALSKAMADIPAGAPDKPAARRAAYLAYTRKPWGGPTEDHLLFTRDLFTLPPQDRQGLLNIHRGLGVLLGGESPESTLQLLDFPGLEAAEIEHLIAGRMAARAACLAANLAAMKEHEASQTEAAQTGPARPEPAATTGPAATKTGPTPQAKPAALPTAPPQHIPTGAASPEPPSGPPKIPAPARAARKPLQHPGRPIIGIASRLRKPYPPLPSLLKQPPGQSPPLEPNPYPSLYERAMKSLAKAGP